MKYRIPICWRNIVVYCAIYNICIRTPFCHIIGIFIFFSKVEIDGLFRNNISS